MSPRRRSKAVAYALDGDAERIPVVIEGCGHQHRADVERDGPCDSCRWLAREFDAPTTVPPLDYYPRKDGG